MTEEQLHRWKYLVDSAKIPGNVSPEFAAHYQVSARLILAVDAELERLRAACRAGLAELNACAHGEEPQEEILSLMEAALAID